MQKDHVSGRDATMRNRTQARSYTHNVRSFLTNVSQDVGNIFFRNISPSERRIENACVGARTAIVIKYPWQYIAGSTFFRPRALPPRVTIRSIETRYLSIPRN